jgi:hypothetical protein
MAILPRLFLAAIGVAFFSIGIWVTFAEVRRVRRTRTWPRVIGQVVESRVTVDSDSDSTTYGVHVEYRYRVFGSDHKGSTDITGLATLTRRRAEEVCSTYAVGRELPIACNPEHAEQSEIADSDQRSIKVSVILFGIFCAVFAIVWTLAITG